MPKDNFSRQAGLYARYRPHYPSELFEFLYSKLSCFEAAWDCATGNGQVAAVLQKRFTQVFATDISQKQLDQAPSFSNVHYSIGSAEASGLTEKVDLITVAQALHWFDFQKFFKEVQRLSKPETLLAYWAYDLLHINEKIDPMIRHFHDEVMGTYWDPERLLVDRHYRDIELPLANKVDKTFSYSVSWRIDHLHGYLTSWSSTQKYIQQHSTNPVDELIQKVNPYWASNMRVTFPIFLALGKVS